MHPLTPQQVGQAILNLSARHGLNLPLLPEQEAREMSWLLSNGMLNLLAAIHHYLPGAKYYHLHVTSEIAIIADLNAPDAKDYVVKQGIFPFVKCIYPFVKWRGVVLTAEGSTSLESLKDAIRGHSRFLGHRNMRFLENRVPMKATGNEKERVANERWLEEVSRIQAQQLQITTPVVDHQESVRRI